MNGEGLKVNSKKKKAIIKLLKSLILSLVFFPLILFYSLLWVMDWAGDKAYALLDWMDDFEWNTRLIVSVSAWVILIIIFFTVDYSLFTRF